MLKLANTYTGRTSKPSYNQRLESSSRTTNCLVALVGQATLNGDRFPTVAEPVIELDPKLL
jgi:hypothetical protein